MDLGPIAYTLTDWSRVPAVTQPGATGTVTSRSLQLGELRVRIVEYSPGCLADHWCERGHVVYVLAGELITELADGTRSLLPAGHSYQVGNGLSSRSATTTTGATLFILD